MIPAKHRLSHLAETVFESSSSNSGIWDMTIRENIYAQLQLTPLRLPRRPQCCLSFQGWLQGFYCQDLPSIHTLKTKHHRDKWLRLLRIMVFPADRHGMRIITSLTLKASLSPRLLMPERSTPSSGENSRSAAPGEWHLQVQEILSGSEGYRNSDIKENCFKVCCSPGSGTSVISVRPGKSSEVSWAFSHVQQKVKTVWKICP